MNGYKAGIKTFSPKGQLVFNQVDPVRATELISVTQGLGLPQVTGQAGTYFTTDINEYGSKAVDQVRYTNSFAYSKLMRRFDHVDILSKSTAQGTFRTLQRKDDIMAAILRGSATTTTTYDNLSLLNGSHTVGTTGLTQTNITTGGVTEPNLITAIANMYQMLDENGLVGELDTCYILYPPVMDNTIKRFLHSEGSPTTANRYTNPLMGEANIQTGEKIQLIPWARLGAAAGGSDTTAYLVSNKMFHNLMYLEAIGPETTVVTPDKTNNGSYEVRFELHAAAVVPHYYGIWGITA